MQPSALSTRERHWRRRDGLVALLALAAFTIVLFAAAATATAQAAVVSGWRRQASTTHVGLWGVSFVNEHDGWAVGDSGTILATTDGGTVWRKQNSSTSANLTGVVFVTAKDGWAVGYQPAPAVGYPAQPGATGTHVIFLSNTGVILHTTDGGVTWRPQTVPRTCPPLSAVSFTNSDDGWVVGADGTVLTTRDGGASWQPVTSPSAEDDFVAVVFRSAERGWLLGVDQATGYGHIYATVNGGATWQLEGWETPLYLTGLAFPDTEHGWAVGANGAIIATTDGGSTWFPQASKTTVDLNAASFPDERHGWAVGTTPEGAAIIATSNGGSTWTRQLVSASADLNAVTFVDTTHGWAVGENGVIVATTNGGRPRTVASLTIHLGKLQRGALRLGRDLSVDGSVTPATLTGRVSLTVERLHNRRWHVVATVGRTLSARGLYRWTYKPRERGTDRIRASLAETVAHTAAITHWLSFRVE